MQQDVLGLEVSVQDIVLMHMLYPLANLLDIFSHYLLRESANFLQILIKVLTQTGLKDEIGSLFINEEVIEVDNMRVI